MCVSKRSFICLPLVLFLVSVTGALRAEETPGPWHLISEQELRSIEEYQTRSEREKQTWLLQVQGLRMRAENSEMVSRDLNEKLSSQRDLNRALQQSFNEYEAENLMMISIKNGEIATLKQEKADKTTLIEKYKGRWISAMIIAGALGLAWAIFIGVKVCRIFKVLPF